MKLPGGSEKETRSTQQTCFGVYGGGVYRPGEVSVQRELEDSMSSFQRLCSAGTQGHDVAASYIDHGAHACVQGLTQLRHT